MEPIVPIVKPSTPTPSPARGSVADLIACILAAVAGLVSLGYAVLFFTRFLENDTHIWGVVSAFLLCFGVGAFAYVPAAITSRIAWKAYKKGAKKRALLWTVFLLLPWTLLAIILTFISDMPKIYSLPLVITAALLTAWSLISLRKIEAA